MDGISVVYLRWHGICNVLAPQEVALLVDLGDSCKGGRLIFGQRAHRRGLAHHRAHFEQITPLTHYIAATLSRLLNRSRRLTVNA